MIRANEAMSVIGAGVPPPDSGTIWRTRAAPGRKRPRMRDPSRMTSSYWSAVLIEATLSHSMESVPASSVLTSSLP